MAVTFCLQPTHQRQHTDCLLLLLRCGDLEGLYDAACLLLSPSACEDCAAASAAAAAAVVVAVAVAVAACAAEVVVLLARPVWGAGSVIARRVGVTLTLADCASVASLPRPAVARLRSGDARLGRVAAVGRSWLC